MVVWDDGSCGSLFLEGCSCHIVINNASLRIMLCSGTSHLVALPRYDTLISNVLFSKECMFKLAFDSEYQVPKVTLLQCGANALKNRNNRWYQKMLIILPTTSPRWPSKVGLKISGKSTESAWRALSGMEKLSSLYPCFILYCISNQGLAGNIYMVFYFPKSYTVSSIQLQREKKRDGGNHSS